MQWWNDFVDWFYSSDGQRIFTIVVIPFVSILLAGLIAALIGRSALKRLVEQRDHETRSAAVTSLISAGQNATRWHSQSPAAREHAERLANDADIQVRLLPIAGANYAADWAAHQLADMRTNSVSFSYQADQTLQEYRERLVMWLHKPRKARKLFAADLERWRYDDQAVDPLVADQQRWAEEQFTAATELPVEHAPEKPLHAEPVAAPEEAPAPAPRFGAAAAGATTAATVAAAATSASTPAPAVATPTPAASTPAPPAPFYTPTPFPTAPAFPTAPNFTPTSSLGDATTDTGSDDASDAASDEDEARPAIAIEPLVEPAEPDHASARAELVVEDADVETATTDDAPADAAERASDDYATDDLLTDGDLPGDAAESDHADEDETRTTDKS